MSAIPQHKTDAIFRVENTDRYDDRDVIITNLFDTYDRLMEFGRKHLSDPFVLEGINNVSARDKILREIFSNMIAHRDFSSAYVAKFVIEKDCMYTENASGEAVRQAGGIAEFQKLQIEYAENSLRELCRERKKAEDSFSTLYEKYASGEITQDEYRRAADATEGEKSALSEQIRACQEKLGHLKEDQERLGEDLRVLAECDLIISWNFKHIVNVKTILGVKAVTTYEG